MMDTPQERLRQLDARHAEQRADLLAEIALAERLPVMPKRVSFASNHIPWVTYEVDDIPAALAIMEQYAILPGRAVEKGSLYVGPETPTNGKERWSATELVGVTLQNIHRTGPVDQEIEWWSPAQFEDKILRIKIDVKSWPWNVRPQCRVRYGSHGEVTEAKHDLPDVGEWKRIKWGTGSPDTCRFSLYFDTRAKADQWLRDIITKPAARGLMRQIEDAS